MPKSNEVDANTRMNATEYIIEIPKRTVVSVRYNAFHYGALTLPVKVYVSSKVQLDNNAQFDINIAAMVGFKWGKNKYYNFETEEKGESFLKAWSINVLAGIAKVELNGKNTTNEIAVEETLAAVTTGFALGYHYNNVGIFVASGFDLPFGNNSQEWFFNHQPWLGIGIGLKID